MGTQAHVYNLFLWQNSRVPRSSPETSFSSTCFSQSQSLPTPQKAESGEKPQSDTGARVLPGLTQELAAGTIQIYRIRHCALHEKGSKLKCSFASSYIQIKRRETVQTFLDQRCLKRREASIPDPFPPCTEMKDHTGLGKRLSPEGGFTT